MILNNNDLIQDEFYLIKDIKTNDSRIVKYKYFAHFGNVFVDRYNKEHIYSHDFLSEEYIVKKLNINNNPEYFL